MENFKRTNSNDFSQLDAEKHGYPELREVTITGFHHDPKNPAYVVDVEGIGTYLVESPLVVDTNSKDLSPAQIAVMDIDRLKKCRVDIARILQVDPKAVLIQKQTGKKSA